MCITGQRTLIHPWSLTGTVIDVGNTPWVTQFETAHQIMTNTEKHLIPSIFKLWRLQSYDWPKWTKHHRFSMSFETAVYWPKWTASCQGIKGGSRAATEWPIKAKAYQKRVGYFSSEDLGKRKIGVEGQNNFDSSFWLSKLVGRLHNVFNDSVWLWSANLLSFEKVWVIASRRR